MKQGVIESSVHRAALRNASVQKPKQVHLEFEPLVRVDPTVMIASNREPLQNPRVGDYLLKQTASTEGIASKKSLELKKRYLLGDTGTSGIMKSDSMSMLDSKFRNFRSTITDCQKLLNPAVPDNSATTQNPNKNQIHSDGIVEPLFQTKPQIIKHNDEKENVYNQIVSTRNEINKTDSFHELAKTPTAKVENDEKQPIILAENKNRETINKLCDNSDAKKVSSSVVENDNKRNSFEYSDKFKHSEIISSVTEKEISDYKPVYDSRKEDSNYFSSSQLLDKQKSGIVVVPKKSQELENVEPLLTMPCIVWAQASQKRPDSDTFSSSTSSPAEIPHFILDSTSPDTQATPSELSAKGDDLMQMDSLMLIDGKYIGDPEDLKLMKMPESYSSITSTTVPTTPTTTNKTVIHVQAAENIVDVKPEPLPPKPEPIKIEPKLYKYEPIYKRPVFRFDTKNENKIDTLKNIPLIMPDESEKLSKPSQLSLTAPITTAVQESPDYDKTPTASNPGNLLDKSNHSDSETEMTGQLLTETELSDWTADDAVSENFVDMEFALNSNKGTIKRNKKAKKKENHSHRDKHIGQAPIATNLDFDELEFMDTGSEDSYMEAYAATNKAMLNNRGYVQFVNTQPENPSNYYNYKNIQEKPKRIELGRSNSQNRSNELRDNYYIEQGALLLSNENDLKTPMNESPATISPKLHGDSHEIEDDSLVMIASHGGNTTTEESDALTVVTSPMESAPRFDESSSSTKHNSNLSNASPNKKSSSTIESHTPSHIPDQRKNSDDITYEEYVRQLQMKITQISNARDSIDIRKTKRKHLKNDSITESISNHQYQPEQHQQQPSPSSVIDNNSRSLSIYVGNANESTNVVEKLEEISKERIKQKDLIHDLVMDKLQSKKLSNAEKRLTRSRNRSSALSISPNTSILPPVSVPTASASLTHSQSVTSMSPKYTYQVTEPERRHCLPNQSKALSLSPTKELSIVNQLNHSHRKSSQRPRSANVEEFPVFETPKISKTQSFCIHTTRDSGASSLSHKNADFPYQFTDANVNVFSTPVIPRRRKIDEELTQTTEKLRQEARLRARLKSNQDLGLSPEEKIALLRKRYNLDNSMTTASAVPCSTYNVATPNKSDDMKVREKKMTTSKSVNDISANSSSLSECNPISINSRKKTEFTSNPNLGEEKTSPKRRQKDPERRKSIIQAVSDFFHKKRDKDSPSSPKEKSEGMFGRLRISPKSKSKVHLPTSDS